MVHTPTLYISRVVTQLRHQKPSETRELTAPYSQSQKNLEGKLTCHHERQVCCCCLGSFPNLRSSVRRYEPGEDGKRTPMPVYNHTFQVHPPRNIQDVTLTQSGPHCQNVEVIATLKDGREVCLDPTAKWVKMIIQAILDKAQPKDETKP